jgi:site-specific recombinase XerD
LDLGALERVVAEFVTSTLVGLRDRALLLLGFAAALRRSELVALEVEHLEFSTARGLW